MTILKQSALYPVLRSMSAGGLLASRVVPSVSGPPRRYYAITDHGREILELWREAWGSTTALVESVMTDKVENNV